MVPALLRDRVFRRYWSGSTISMFGDQISGVALPLAAVLALHVGAAQMGYLTALEWLPSLLFGLPAGAWVDRRGRRRRTMIAADLGRAALFAYHPGHLRAARADAGAAVRGHVRRGGAEHRCSTCRTRRCSSRSWRRTGTWTGSRWSTAAARCRSSAARASAACWCRRCPPRSRWPRTRCRSWARRSSWAGSARPSRRPTPPRARHWRARGSSPRSALVRASLIAVATINFFNLMFAALYLLYAVRVLHIRPGLVGRADRRGRRRRPARRAGHQADRGADRGRLGLRGRLPAVHRAAGAVAAGARQPCR